MDGVLERLYEIDGLMERYDWDVDIGTAYLLGLDTAEIASSKTKSQIIGILDEGFAESTPNYLIEEMCSRGGGDYADKMMRLGAFLDGVRV